LPKVKDTEYIFATARVRSIEKNLLTKGKIEKMLDVKTLPEAIKILKECEYGESDSEMFDTFEELLSSEQRKTNDFIKSIAPRPEIFDIFLYPYDYQNLKVLLKAEYLETNADHLLIDAGTIPTAKLKVIVRERNYIALTESMSHALHDAIDVFGRTSDPQMIDLIFDQACFADMQKGAIASESSFLIGYVQTLIDTINIKSFVRVKKMGKSWEFFTKIFIKGGKIAQQLFISGYEESLDQFAERLNYLGFGQTVRLGAEKLEETGKFTELERQCDNKLIDFVKQAKYISFGIEPLVGYMVAKDNEIKTARIILSGKMAKIKTDKIRERVRETYV
jgi:V/A-type H+-transporting ATPase subunit C